ncbi:NAD(P)-dependent oxidoreductase [Candidatus Nanohalovita haloferacivicina]|uniref:NAD(P)-dependent oxidoreductase n=1 Tax=Candidatus Nanohalovita haloferacivicina TaxID=2978046 RepID=UPI00325FD587|nr:D-lactate dehydrogenase [Candidatus Nanohalobia archaeon BNXNv]
MKVAWFDAEEWEKEYLEGKTSNLEIEFFSDSLTEETVEKAEGFDAVTVFVDSHINEKVLDSLEIDLVACRSTGYDHVDLEAAEENNITVCNVPQYGGSTVAEHTFGLILSLSRKIYEAIRKVDNGSFDHEGLRGFDLHGKKLGVIGTGAIGQNVIKIARGFGMDVVAYDPYGDESLEEELGFMYVSLEDLLDHSDVVSLHCPLTDENRHMLSSEEFELMEDTLLVNTARGALIDTEALIQALEDGSVSGAGLDVLEEECYVEEDIEVMGQLKDECDLELILEDHMLMERDDVLVTPHNAFNSREAMHRIADTTLENLRSKENRV